MGARNPATTDERLRALIPESLVRHVDQSAMTITLTRDQSARFADRLDQAKRDAERLQRVEALCDEADEGKRTAMPLTWVDEAMPAVVYVSKIRTALAGDTGGKP